MIKLKELHKFVAKKYPLSALLKIARLNVFVQTDCDLNWLEMFLNTAPQSPLTPQ